MKPMKFNEVTKLLETNGFTLIRSNGHIVYANGTIRIALAHSRVVSPGVVRSVYKAIKQAEQAIPMLKVA
jgi:predicted RNA binding protein YcfA (HicA-like mRNA interferase family)